jgi:hypothetical protein
VIKAQLGKTEVRAPFDGSIGLRYTIHAGGVFLKRYWLKLRPISS